jgi:CheY-like chemotaxis protein/two-component sensor histidine kinase
LASVGTLAAGVAHEINNPLVYVMSNLDMAIEEIRASAGAAFYAPAKELEEMLVEARQGAERVSKIVRALRIFSRADEERRTSIDLRPTLELAINMTFNEIRHRAKLVTDYGETPQIEADAARLGQVFVNLLVNAAQAIPAGAADANEIRITTSTDPTGKAVVEVRDTGPGIPDQLLGRIFDPFFTTKPVGVGTGLGLSICHSIMTAMGGDISVSSEVGRGTTFQVVIPRARCAQPAPTVAVGVPSPSSSGRRAAVLVVDDEPGVGMVLRRILRDHDVTVLGSGAEALDVIAAGRQFDVIFSDLMMPQMTGMEFYRRVTLRSTDIAARMVFMTGGAFTAFAHEFLDEVGNERIEKPFAPSVVRELVQKFLR